MDALGELRSDIANLLTDYYQRNHEYRFDELLQPAARASIASGEGIAWLVELAQSMDNPEMVIDALQRIPGGVTRARSTLQARGGLGVLIGRFVAILRAVVPAAAGAAPVRYRTFLFYNVVGGIIWGVGYCLLGYAAGSAYAAIERTVGTGVAIALAVVVLAAVAFWAIRRHRRERAGLIGDPLIPDAAPPDVVNPAGPERPG